MLTSAYELINIQPNIDYKSDGKGGPVFRIHALKDNESEVIVEGYGGEAITFPRGSFIAGAVYDILIKKMKFNTSKCKFVGYKFKNKPYNLDI